MSTTPIEILNAYQHFYAIYANAVEQAADSNVAHPAHRDIILQFADAGLAGMKMLEPKLHSSERFPKEDMKLMQERITVVRNAIQEFRQRMLVAIYKKSK